WTAAHRLALLHELSFVAVRQTRSAEVTGDQSSSSAVPLLAAAFTRVSFHSLAAGTNKIDPAHKAAAISATNVRHTADSRLGAQPAGTQWSSAANPYSNTCPPIAACAQGRGSQKPLTATRSRAYGSSSRQIGRASCRE